MAIAVLFALSLNVITGFCGQVSLGHAAFLGIGVYTSAMLSKAGVPIVITFIPAMGMAALIGLVVGAASLRVRHDFLAITTMGVVFLFTGIVRKQETLGGEIGIWNTCPRFWTSRIICDLFAVCSGLSPSRQFGSVGLGQGLAFDSIAEDEDTARLLGINVPKFKLFAFVVGTAGAGLAGALYAHQVRFIGPDSFGFVESISVLAMVIVGGIRSVWGVILAAFLSALPQFFHMIDDYKLLVYGLLLFGQCALLPKALMGC